jgi:hypothetical protein
MRLEYTCEIEGYMCYLLILSHKLFKLNMQLGNNTKISREKLIFLLPVKHKRKTYKKIKLKLWSFLEATCAHVLCVP